MNLVETSKVEVPAIHKVYRRWFQYKIVEDIDVVNLPIGNNDKGWDAPAQIQKCVEFDRSLVLSKLCPGNSRMPFGSMEGTISRSSSG